MIKHLIPYGVTGVDDYWSGVDLYNHSPKDAYIEVQVKRLNGSTSNTINITIAPLHHYIISPGAIEVDLNEPTGRFTLWVFTPEGVFPSPFIGKGGAAPNMLRCVEAQEGGVVIPGNRSKIESTEYMRYNGNSACQWMYENYYQAIKDSCLSLRMEFPLAKDLVVNLGDGCPSVGNCPNHPGSSHGKLSSIDFDYLTFETNVTQYRRQTAGPLTDIWDEDDKLSTNIFDWKRNYFLWKSLWNRLDSFRGAIDERIHLHMVQQIDKAYGRNAVDEFKSYIKGDAPKAYNHHTHLHAKLGD